jgi:hypothetical protein
MALAQFANSQSCREHSRPPQLPFFTFYCSFTILMDARPALVVVIAADRWTDYTLYLLSLIIPRIWHNVLVIYRAIGQKTGDNECCRMRSHHRKADNAADKAIRNKYNTNPVQSYKLEI